MTLPIKSTLLAEFTYELRPVERGYANRTLYVNLETIRSAKSLSPSR